MKGIKILHQHKGIEGSGIYYAIVRGDLRQAGKSGIEGSGNLLGDYSPIYTREVRIIISHALFIDLLGKLVVLEIKEDIYGAFWARVWKVLIGVLIYITISPYHRWVGAISEGICRINQILSALTGLMRLRGKVDLQVCYKRKRAAEESNIQQQERARSSRKEHEAPPMISLQENLASSIILADVQKVTSAPECEENGLDVVNELLGDENNDVENDVMELDEERVTGVGNDEGSGDGFQNLSDGEVEVNSDQATEGLNLAIGDVVNDLPEDKEPAVGEAEKKKVVRKGLFKSTVVAGGSTKARMFQALIANVRLLNLQPVKERELNIRRKRVPQTPIQPLPNLRSFMEVQAMVELCKQGVLSDLAPLRFYQVLQNGFTLQQLMCLIPLNQTQRSYKCLEMVAFAIISCTSAFLSSATKWIYFTAANVFDPFKPNTKIIQVSGDGCFCGIWL
ncbi:hypothetical protein DY000_02012071 [Brassica cretica]|uniref:Uncharacterized protein n=1 Tax=Brassica cretica TaxID=69181 RepID=A0ABQ7CWF3_BRACR|nr:hypothetical protein DY000_02012071 [Brassica cretica]